MAAIGLAVAAAAPAAAAPAAAQKAQAIYDAAQAAFDKGDWAAAIAGFEKVGGDLAQPPRGAAQATVRARLATAYLMTGRTPLARATAAQAIAALGAEHAVERANASITLGDAARYDLDMTEALDAYEQALRLAPAGAEGDDIRLPAQLGIAKAATTLAPQRAAAALDAVLLIPRIAALKPRELAGYEMLRGRAAMNAGDLPRAKTLLDKALKDSGGLSGTKVDHAQIAIRSDAAIAAQLQHDDERTRELLTWTGAGHDAGQDWTDGADAEPPVCGEATGLRESDTAVVEFVIGSDGTVSGAMPVYASRAGPASLEFARAVQGWRWSNAAVAKLTPFWRAAARVQLRCVSRPQPLKLGDGFKLETARWLLTKGLPAEQIVPFADSINPPAKTDPRTAQEDLAALPVLLALAGPDEPRAVTAHLDPALDRADAPADVRAWVVSERAGFDTMTLRQSAMARAASLGRALGPFAARFPASRATAWLRLEQALATERAGSFEEARPLLAAVLATPPASVGAGDPIRQIATLHLVALDRRRGDTQAADTRIAESGLSVAQCAAFDVRPAPTNASIGSSAFPTEALRWRFNGFVRESFDIAADGSVTNVRAVIAYPPFVFERATERAIARFRYLPPVIAGAPAGCHGQNLNIRYRIPG